MFGPRPEVPAGYDIYLESFNDLSTERVIGAGGLGPIPVTKIMEYANLVGMPDMFQFKRIIMQLDNEYITLIQKKD